MNIELTDAEREYTARALRAYSEGIPRAQSIIEKFETCELQEVIDNMMTYSGGRWTPTTATLNYKLVEWLEKLLRAKKEMEKSKKDGQKFVEELSKCDK